MLVIKVQQEIGLLSIPLVIEMDMSFVKSTMLILQQKILKKGLIQRQTFMDFIILNAEMLMVEVNHVILIAQLLAICLLATLQVILEV